MEKARHPKVTLSCEYCASDFTVMYGERSRRYCSKSCASKGMSRPDSVKTTSCCVECGKEFDHYGSRVLCGRDCTSKYMSKTRIGENNPAYKGEYFKTTCTTCGQDFTYNRVNLHKDQIRKYCSLACSRGKIGLSSPSPRTDVYPKEFGEILKETIRNRDGRTCLLCGKPECENGEKLSVHYIDYDKQNLDDANLVSLCRRCHSTTNGSRQFWHLLFTAAMSGSKLVQKPWGAEIHIVNHCDYCLKYLAVYEGNYFSNHYHFVKKELWHCVAGKFEVVLTDPSGNCEFLVLAKGDKLEVEPGMVHQIFAKEHSLLVEVSTQSFVEDSYKDYPNLLV